MGRYCKPEAHMHAAAVAFYRRIKVAFYPRKIDNSIKLAVYFFFAHAQYGPIEVYVFAARKFRVHAGTYLKQACHPAAELYASGAWGGYAAEYFKQGTFTGPIAANNAEYLTGLHGKAYITQGPYILAAALGTAVVGLAYTQVGVLFAQQPVPPPVKVVRHAARTYGTKAVLLANVIYLNN
jgi:hypothetical protein